MLDIQSIRNDFPILSRQVYGKPLTYFDNGATTQKPQCVIDKISELYSTVNANVHRGVHFLSQEATDHHEASRVLVKEFIGASSPAEIIFTRGTTESINLVTHSFCKAFCKEGDEILISGMEHHSNIVPWQLQGMTLRVMDINERGELYLDDIESKINERTRLISMTYISNVLGTVNPVKKVIELAHKHQIPILIDAAQAVQHLAIDVKELDCDFLVFSSHKVYGPTGIGVLYGKQNWLEQMPPYQGGGEMIQNVSFEKTTFNELPFKFEAGTPDYIGTTALAEALTYVKHIGLDKIAAYEHDLLTYTEDKLRQIDGLRIIGHAKDKSSVISFLIDGIHPYDVGTLLDKMGIAVRTGHHCAEPLMHLLGIEGTIRASLAFYNTHEEADRLVAALQRIVSMFR